MHGICLREVGLVGAVYVVDTGSAVVDLLVGRTLTCSAHLFVPYSATELKGKLTMKKSKF